MDRWGTPDTPPIDAGTSTYCLEFPNTRQIHAVVNAAISQLIYESQWFDEGTMTVEEITQIFKVMYLEKRKCSVVGEIKETVTLTGIPDNWLQLTGQIIQQADYPELWDAAPTFWRIGSSTAMQLPDTRRRYTAHGLDDIGEPNYAVGKTFGSNDATISIAQMPIHTHNDGFAVGSQAGAGALQPASPLLGGTPYPITSTGGGLPHENRPSTFTIYRFIVAKP